MITLAVIVFGIGALFIFFVVIFAVGELFSGGGRYEERQRISDLEDELWLQRVMQEKQRVEMLVDARQVKLSLHNHNAKEQSYGKKSGRSTAGRLRQS